LESEKMKTPTIRAAPAEPSPAVFAISLLLRQLRRQAKLSQEELGAKIGAHRNTIWRFEQGDPMPLHLFLPFCEAVGQKPAAVIDAIVAAIETSQAK
jgi:DNA-binding XRE family transcriptional regulator